MDRHVIVVSIVGGARLDLSEGYSSGHERPGALTADHGEAGSTYSRHPGYSPARSTASCANPYDKLSA